MSKRTNKPGQVAILLVMIVMILITIVTAAVAVAMTSLSDTTAMGRGEQALAVAEAGAEEAILRLLRDPGYTGQTGLSINGGTADITVTGSGPKTITAIGMAGGNRRQIQVVISNTGGQLKVSSWREI